MKRIITLIASCGAMAAATLPSGCATTPVSAVPMKTGVKRLATLAEVKPDMVDRCKALYAKPDPCIAAALKSAHIRNHTVYLKKIENKYCLYYYLEYDGCNFAADMARLDAKPAVKTWRDACAACMIPVPNVSTAARPWYEAEEVFFTDGATTVVPTPAKYSRIGMITGLKPEKEAEYRTLHATTWPGVLKGIADCNLRNFSITLSEFGGKLYLVGYLEYVGSDNAADDAKGKALPVNKRWWKFTDACQQPLPAAAAKGGIWDGMEELYHLE